MFVEGVWIGVPGALIRRVDIRAVNPHSIEIMKVTVSYMPSDKSYLQNVNAGGDAGYYLRLGF